MPAPATGHVPSSSAIPDHGATVAQDPGLTGRALIIAVILTLLAGLWVRQSEILVLATQVTESIPAIPGLAALVLLLPLNSVLKRIRGARPLSRAEILVIFFFVTLSSTVMGVGITQFMFALIGTPFYSDDVEIPSVRPYLPAGLVVHNVEAIRQMYERALDGKVPWSIWIEPCLLWLLFFVALWCTLYCMMALFYRAWSEDEKLLFPQVMIPLEMTGGESGTAPFFRNRLMWAGFALAAVYNGINIAHALMPSFPAIGKMVDLSELFKSPPWSEISPLQFHIRPELVGLGYLVSTEISLTVWVSFVLMKAAAVIGVSMGVTPNTLPYSEEQGIGAYLVLAVSLVWLSRTYLKETWRSAVKGSAANGYEGISYRFAYAGLIGGILTVWTFMTLAGMAYWTSLAYLMVVMAVALVYGRLRAEAGVPLVWLFPYYMQKKLLLYSFGSRPFVAAGERNVPTWALFTFLARGYYPAVTGYQVEGMEISRRGGINPRRMAAGALLAITLGIVVGWYNHLTPYYQHGAAQLRGGIWGEWIAHPEYAAAARYPATPIHPDLTRVWASVSGAFIVFALWTLRLRCAGSALHPLGYVMACSYGSLIWSSFLIVWIVKSAALRYGGVKFYRATIPFFLGMALGHFAIAGIFWGLIGAWTGDSVRGYEVYFG